MSSPGLPIRGVTADTPDTPHIAMPDPSTEPVQDAPRERRRSDVGTPTVPPEQRLDVLIVDDDPVIRRLLTRALERTRACSVRMAEDVESAMTLLEERPCELMLLDYYLGEGDGLELLRSVILRWPGIETAFVTGSRDPELVSEAYKLGVVDYIPKDTRLARKTVDVVGRAIWRRSLRRGDSTGAEWIVEARRSILQTVEELFGEAGDVEKGNEALGLIDKMISLLEHDPLTGLYNRTAIAARIQEEITKGDGLGADLCILALDLDGFKQLNDTAGHKAGDEALIAVAHALTEHVRVIDSVARIGGDEFLALLPATPPHEGHLVAGRLVQGVVDLGIPGLAMSAGVAPWVPGDTVQDVIHAADTALYDAKRTGKGRAVLNRRSDLAPSTPAAPLDPTEKPAVLTHRRAG